jgi:hypothetical protein
MQKENDTHTSVDSQYRWLLRAPVLKFFRRGFTKLWLSLVTPD